MLTLTRLLLASSVPDSLKSLVPTSPLQWCTFHWRWHKKESCRSGGLWTPWHAVWTPGADAASLDGIHSCSSTLVKHQRELEPVILLPMNAMSMTFFSSQRVGAALQLQAIPACVFHVSLVSCSLCVNVGFRALAGSESLVSEASTAVTGLPTVQDARATTRRELDELLQVSASFSSVNIIILKIRSLCDPSIAMFGFLIPLLILSPFISLRTYGTRRRGASVSAAL
jgi:hypothetical protein